MDAAVVFAAGSAQQPNKLQHSPPSSLEEQGSPTKRARLDAPPSLQTAVPQQPQLQQLPLPLLLLTLAQTLHTSALSLHPVLARRPSPSPPSSTTSSSPPSSQQQRYARAWTSYSRLLAGCVSLLRKVVELTSGGAGGEGGAGGRMELRAREMLAEVLELCGGGARAEREKVVGRAIVAAEKHPTLDPFKPFLTFQQITTTLSSLPSSSSLSSSSSNSTTLKFARTTLRRLLSSPSYSSSSLSTPLLPAKDLPNPSWTYQLLLLSATLPSTPYPEALAAWREIERVSATRGDAMMVLVAKLGQARLALGGGEWAVVASSLSALSSALGWSSAPSTSPSTSTEAAPPAEFPKALQIQAFLIAALYNAHMGDIKGAKERLKAGHALLDAEGEKDAEGERGEREGWAVIKINPSASNPPSSPRSAPAPLHSPTAVTLKLPTRSAVYTFAFLVSVAVHRDPFGTKPRSILFVNEGLKLLEGKLNGSEHPPPLTTPSSLPSSLLSSAELKVHLLLFSAELNLMRSAWEKAEGDLNLAISTARTYSHPGEGAGGGEGELWARFKGRITLGMGLLAQGRGEEQLAEECFETVLMDEVTSSGAASSKMSRKKSTGAGGDKEQQREDEIKEEQRNLLVLAKMSLLLLKISQGVRVRLSTSSSLSTSSTASDQHLTTLARSLSSLSLSSPCPPSLQLVAEVTQALTKGEITKAKAHLSVALTLANNMGGNHTKGLLLGLLGNLFAWTRNDQAQKMLLASLNIARGMGARPDSRTKEQQAEDKTGGVVRENEVGNARLGLWVGERLAEAYKRDDPSKLRKQEQLNEMHRQVLQKEWKGGAL